MTAPGAVPDAGALAEALRARGLRGRVEARERLALLVPEGDWPELLEPARRRELHALAASCGFTHVAIEVDDAGLDAAPGAG